jgi:hypothetical protein
MRWTLAMRQRRSHHLYDKEQGVDVIKNKEPQAAISSLRDQFRIGKHGSTTWEAFTWGCKKNVGRERQMNTHGMGHARASPKAAQPKSSYLATTLSSFTRPPSLLLSP